MAVRLQKLSQQQGRLIKAVGLIIVLSALQPFLWQYVGHLAETLQQKRSQGQQLANVEERSQAITAQLEAQDQLLQQLNTVTPPSESLPHIVERLEQLADATQVALTITQIRELRTDEEAATVTVTPVTVAVRAAGTLEQLLRYVEAAEHVQEITVLDAVAIAPRAATDQAAPPYSLTMSVTFFLGAPLDG